MAAFSIPNFSPSQTKTTTKNALIPTTPFTTHLSLSSPKPTFSLLSTSTTTIKPSTIRCCSTTSPRPQYTPSRIPDPNYIRIFDTTLRDGEQSPGASMTPKQKLDIACQLARLGVDIIEAGFPAASNADLEAVKAIAMSVGNEIDEEGYVPVICGLSRCNKADIDAAWAAVKYAKRPRIHTFIATSEIHMQHKLNKTRDEVVEIAKNMVGYARSLGCHDVEFSPEDAGRKIWGGGVLVGVLRIGPPLSSYHWSVSDIKLVTSDVLPAVISNCTFMLNFLQERSLAFSSSIAISIVFEDILRMI